MAGDKLTDPRDGGLRVPVPAPLQPSGELPFAPTP